MLRKFFHQLYFSIVLEPIKVQLALDPDALKALNGANAAAGDSSPAVTSNNNNYGGNVNGGLGTLEALALGALLSGARAPCMVFVFKFPWLSNDVF